MLDTPFLRAPAQQPVTFTFSFCKFSKIVRYHSVYGKTPTTPVQNERVTSGMFLVLTILTERPGEKRLWMLLSVDR